MTPGYRLTNVERPKTYFLPIILKISTVDLTQSVSDQCHPILQFAKVISIRVDCIGEFCNLL